MAPLIVRTISRYLLRQHFAPLGFALAVLTSLMLIQQVAKQLSGLLGKGLPAGVISAMFAPSLPFIVAGWPPPGGFVAGFERFSPPPGGTHSTALPGRGA